MTVLVSIKHFFGIIYLNSTILFFPLFFTHVRASALLLAWEPSAAKKPSKPVIESIAHSQKDQEIWIVQKSKKKYTNVSMS